MLCSDPLLFAAATSSIESQPAYGHLIGNQWIKGEGSALQVSAPATGKRFAWLARGTKRNIDDAVCAARAALSGAWSNMTAAERGRLLLRYSATVASNAERLAWVEAHDTGKPISQARADMHAVARYFEFYGGGADKIHGEVIPYLNGYSVTVVREPLGVTAHITPWNYP
ncbi:MAG: aldehyde dehydrogenase family protein, partial [Burkholderiaceae bacterium]